MKIYILRLLASFIFYELTLALWSSTGVPRSFTCKTTQFANWTTRKWVLPSQNSYQSIFLCTTTNGTRCDPSNVDKLDLYWANMTPNSSAYISVLTIKNVSASQNNTSWFCIAIDSQGNSKSLRFDLNKYYETFLDADEIPQCGNVAAADYCEIQVTCVIPTYKYGTDFNYSIFANMRTNRLISWRRQLDREKLNTTGYYKMTLNITVLASHVGPGTHRFFLLISPYSGSTVEFISQFTKPFKIDYPRAHLADDCSIKNHMKENSSNSCTCYNINQSILPTTVSWSQDNTTLNTSETLYYRAGRNETYQCQISNCLTWTDTASFKPSITYKTISTDRSNTLALSVGTFVGIVIAVIGITLIVCITVQVIYYKKKNHFQAKNKNNLVYDKTTATNPYHNSDVNPYEAPEIKPVSTSEYLTIVPPDVNANEMYAQIYNKAGKGKTRFQKENQNDTHEYNTTKAANPYRNSDFNPYEAPVIKPASANESLTIVPPERITNNKNV